jgi:hypothetical protein
MYSRSGNARGFLFPIQVLCAVTAIISGGLGIQAASDLENNTGKGQAIAGIILGLLYFVTIASMIGLAMMLGVGIVVLDNLIVFADI